AAGRLACATATSGRRGGSGALSSVAGGGAEGAWRTTAGAAGFASAVGAGRAASGRAVSGTAVVAGRSVRSATRGPAGDPIHHAMPRTTAASAVSAAV